MKAIIIYHKVDYDGVGSMLVAHSALSQNPEIEEINLFGWNYGDKVPDLTYEIAPDHDLIVMVDISFPPEAMLELKGLEKFGVHTIWIDHHITAIEDSHKHGYDDLDGLRFDGLAAIENTWHYFYPGVLEPMIVQLLGTYDVWNKSRFDWDGIVLPTQTALKAKYSFNIETLLDVWPELTSASLDELMPLIDSGKLILKFQRSQWGSTIKRYSFEVTVAGKYRGIACNSPEFSSNLFGTKSLEYDVMIVTQWDPNSKYWRISMYVDPERESDFHAGEYLKANYNGGGHKGAAGGQLNQEQYLRLINDLEI